MILLKAFTLAIIFSMASTKSRVTPNSNVVNAKNADEANKLIEYFTKGSGKGHTYDWLAILCDKFGNRYAPSPRYDAAAAYLVDELKQIGVDKVWTEMAPEVPNWTRLHDRPNEAVLMKPRHLVIPLLPLGNSTATPEGGVKNVKAVVVRSFDELAKLEDSTVRGSVVVFNQNWLGDYGDSVQYRLHGATQAAKRGAVATLVRSVTPQSLYTLHTGWNHYDVTQPNLQIPTGSITVEDAELLYRLQQDGYDLEMNVHINTVNTGAIAKPNVIAEITGSQYPDEMVLFGGHLDSWDVGEGAMDDGGGVAISFQALKAVKKLGLKPKRTMRAVFWTGEEFNYVGSAAYYKAHSEEASRMSLVMESDSGTFSPLGFHFAGNAAAQSMLQEVSNLLAPIGASRLSKDGTVPGDPEPFVTNHGVPGVELMTQNDKYFWYHHTPADTMTIHNTSDLDACAATWTTMAYTVASLDKMLPHGQ